MTLETFRTIVSSYGKQGGVSFLKLNTGDDTDLDRLILRGLKDFTRYTYSIFDFSFTFTTVASSATYSVSGMFQIDHMEVNAVVMRNFAGGIGPESRTRFFHRHPTFRTEAQGVPTVWVWQPPNQILFHPTPSSGFVVNMAGFREHADFTLGAVGSAITLELDDHVADVAALWVSLKLKYPGMEGELLFQQILAMDALASDKIQDYRSSNIGNNLGYTERAHNVRRYYT